MANDSTTACDPAGEWLFQTDGQVFGPVTGDRLVELLAAGSISTATRVARDGEAWRPLGAVPEFLVEVKKAEARVRVEAEVSAVRARNRRHAVLRWCGIAGVIAVLVVVAARAASFAAVERPWHRRTALLDDFGAQITIGTVLVSRSAPAGDDEVAIPLDTPRRGPRRSEARSTSSGAGGLARHASGTAAGQGLVLARYDPDRIGAVVARQQGSLAACVREEARRSPDLRGELPIEFAVGNDGKVAELWIDDPRFKSGPLHECMFRKLREWAFDPFPGQRPVVSLAFRIGER